MMFRQYLLLYLLALLVLLSISVFLTAPGYMDAEYYLAGGLQLVRDNGLYEPYIWNYLADPPTLPVPSHTYWMPLASLISWMGMSLAGSDTFAAARLPFILLAAAVAPLTAALSYSLRPCRDLALLAGLLAAVPGFYLPFITTTATFVPYLFLGAIFFLLSGRLLNPILLKLPGKQGTDETRDSPTGDSSRTEVGKRLSSFHFASLFNHPANMVLLTLGILAGLMYLTRTDGLLYLFVGLVVAHTLPSRKYSPTPSSTSLPASDFHTSLSPISNNSSINHLTITIALRFSRYLHLLLGFTLVTLPWFVRNLSTFGTIFPPGSSRALWLVNYDQMFSYPASMLTFDSWWSAGLSAILDARLWALGVNLVRTLTVQGMVFLLPLILIACWRLRHHPLVRLGVLVYLVSMIGMTLAFPFASARGGFFHAGAAFQPLFWALAPIGLESFISWGSRIRGWQTTQALQFFSAGLVALALLLTGLTTIPRLVPENGLEPAWNRGQAAYARLEVALLSEGAQPYDPVLVNNPPGYYLVSGRPSLVIPHGELATTLEVAARYGARYLLLDRNHPQGLKDLYLHPIDHPGLRYLTTFESTHIFKIELEYNE